MYAVMACVVCAFNRHSNVSRAYRLPLACLVLCFSFHTTEKRSVSGRGATFCVVGDKRHKMTNTSSSNATIHSPSKSKETIENKNSFFGVSVCECVWAKCDVGRFHSFISDSIFSISDGQHAIRLIKLHATLVFRVNSTQHPSFNIHSRSQAHNTHNFIYPRIFEVR